MSTLFCNGQFYQSAGTWAAGLLVRDGRIVEVLPDTAHVDAARAAASEVVDLGGQWVMPAFEDAHNHPGSHSRAALELDFRDRSVSWEEAARQIAERVTQTPTGEWVAVHGWNETTWPDLSQRALDALATDHGLIIANVSYHSGMVNTRGLEMLETASVLVSDEAAEAGRLEEEDFERVFDATAPAVGVYGAALGQFYNNLLRHGIVGVQDLEVRSIRQLETYWELDRQGGVPMPTTVFVTPVLFEQGARFRELLAQPWQMVDVRGLKLMLDGAFGAHTAAVSTPYADNPSTGTVRMSLQDIETAVAQAVDFGLTEVAMHCIGDVACATAAAAMEQLGPKYPTILRWRCEHFELPSAETIPRVARAGGAVCMQPNFLWDAHNYANRLGEERLGLINLFRTVLEAGVPLAFGSDDMPTGPLEGIHWAVFRGVSDLQQVSMAEAWAASSLSAAQLAGATDRGTLAVGMEANLICFTVSPFALDVDEFAPLAVNSTWRRGVCLFDGRDA